MVFTMRCFAVAAVLLTAAIADSAVTFHGAAARYDCPDAIERPVRLDGLSGGGGGGAKKTYLLLLSPSPDAGGHLCTLTRVDDEATMVFVPIARSYDGHDWQVQRGRYIHGVSVECGESSASGSGYRAGEYLCQVAVPALDESAEGYYLTRFEETGVSPRTRAARFLERHTWGASELTSHAFCSLQNLLVSQQLALM